tara:strand:+ start:392 stop:556 length:165 start_codon:yes stop_codon:yes gene_type:complete
MVFYLILKVLKGVFQLMRSYDNYRRSFYVVGRGNKVPVVLTVLIGSRQMPKGHS